MFRASLIIAALLLAPAQAGAQWRGLEWNMRIDAVRALYPRMKPLGEEAQRSLAPYLSGAAVLVDPVEAGTNIQGLLLFDDNRLREMRLLTRNLEDGKALLAVLRAAFGEPHDTNSLSLATCTISRAGWDDAPRNMKVRFTLSDCTDKNGAAVIEPLRAAE